MNEKKEIRISLGTAVVLIIAMVLIGLMTGVIFYLKMENKNIAKNNDVEMIDKNTVAEVAENNKQAFKYALNGNSLEDFDIRFLQLENTKENKIYSPLSIKYALAMLNEGAEGETKTQISSLIGDYKAKKYINSANMSFANALFIRDTYKNSIKESYINNLKTKYNADVKYDAFTSAQEINSWTREKTLGLIDSIIDDESVNNLSFALVNALGIDMEWQNKFLEPVDESVNYIHEKFGWYSPSELISNNFENINNEISGMGIVASINNYDIVNTLGEEKIRQTVGNEFRKYLEENPYGDAQYYLEKSNNIETAVKEYLDDYIQEINSNYKDVSMNTDFSFYTDEKVKAFSKDLKEYNGTTLQYIAIMPENDLDKYISNTTAKDINTIIGNLKELKSQNFKEGVITQILGYIPKFKFDYDLDLIKDLNTMGVKDIFEENKANLKGITNEENTYISEAKHKANIEFTQDGIKAGAVTFGEGYGAGGFFDYLYDVPVEEIDLVFDKPYMFIIRDKDTGEVWFAGTVYNPLSIEEEPMLEELKSNWSGSELTLTKYSDFLKFARPYTGEEDLLN